MTLNQNESTQILDRQQQVKRLLTAVANYQPSQQDINNMNKARQEMQKNIQKKYKNAQPNQAYKFPYKSYQEDRFCETQANIENLHNQNNERKNKQVQEKKRQRNPLVQRNQNWGNKHYPKDQFRTSIKPSKKTSQNNYICSQPNNKVQSNMKSVHKPIKKQINLSGSLKKSLFIQNQSPQQISIKSKLKIKKPNLLLNQQNKQIQLRTQNNINFQHEEGNDQNLRQFKKYINFQNQYQQNHRQLNQQNHCQLNQQNHRKLVHHQSNINQSNQYGSNDHCSNKYSSNKYETNQQQNNLNTYIFNDTILEEGSQDAEFSNSRINENINQNVYIQHSKPLFNVQQLKQKLRQTSKDQKKISVHKAHRRTVTESDIDIKIKLFTSSIKKEGKNNKQTKKKPTICRLGSKNVDNMNSSYTNVMNRTVSTLSQHSLKKGIQICSKSKKSNQKSVQKISMGKTMFQKTKKEMYTENALQAKDQHIKNDVHLKKEQLEMQKTSKINQIMHSLKQQYKNKNKQNKCYNQKSKGRVGIKTTICN